jgi:hypothetical protein
MHQSLDYVMLKERTFNDRCFVTGLELLAYIVQSFNKYRKHAVAQLVEVLCYNPVDRGFDSR